ncbi:YfbU family protein [Rhizobium cauense]|uniref:YfbU family protein n=1 Tax=Rhizobium cauense TaxID=1166683 RepID=UPI001C6E2983|nr:YfbU family protein [Rhizobium cauense]MBW9113175.1 YfbU family protein [Rhizobium cauense]
MPDTSLTFAERLILSNQFRILGLLNPSDIEHYRQAGEIVESGYEFLYSEISPAMNLEPISSEFGQEVYDILDLFRAIEGSAMDLNKTTSDLHAKFEGFDGNNDDDHFGFAKFVRRDLGRWSELEKYPHNSHSSASLPRYRKMLQRWQSIGKPFKMTEDQIASLVA